MFLLQQLLLRVMLMLLLCSLLATLVYDAVDSVAVFFRIAEGGGVDPKRRLPVEDGVAGDRG